MIILGILLAIAVITLSLAHYTYRICFYSPLDRTEDPYALLEGEQYDTVSHLVHRCTVATEKRTFCWVKTASIDRVSLYGRYFHNTDSAPLIILFHGYRSCALRDCLGGFVLAQKLGFNVLAVDQRAHGRSGGNTITFGVMERYDCLCWVKFANEELTSGAPIVLSGISMGAATVLMAAQLSLPDNVVGILADCPYSSPKAIIKKVCRDRKIPADLAYPFVWLGAKIFGHFQLNSASAIKAITNAQIPILLYHGEDDRYVPCEMSRDICSANKNKCTLQTFPVAGHGLSYLVDPIRYEKITYDFLKSIPTLNSWLQSQKPS